MSRFFLIILALLITAVTIAQIPDGYDPNLDPSLTVPPFPCDNEPCPDAAPYYPFTQDVPIDGGLSILLLAGVGYGVKKVRDELKKPATRSKT